MKTSKLLLGTLSGGVTFFLIGWLIYGIIMRDFMSANFNQCMAKPETETVWWALIVSNFAWALAYALIISWSNMVSAFGGLKIGLVIGFLIMLSFDLSFYSMSKMYSGLNAMMIDILVGMVYSAIGGAVIGGVMGMGEKES